MNERPGSLFIAFPMARQVRSLSSSICIQAIPSLGSETTKVAFFSSLTPSSRDANIGETLFSTMAVTSSSAEAALSNLAKFLSFSLQCPI